MDLSTKYLGLELKNPLVVSSSPISENIDSLKEAQAAGASAVVMFSLFEEQIRHEDDSMVHFMEFGTESYAESLSFFPEPTEYKAGPADYLDKVAQAKKALDIPVIGSLNGVTNEGWVDYGKKIQDAGADALELNVYYLPTAKDTDARDVEQRYINVLKAVKSKVSIPVSVKLSPFFSSIGQTCTELVAAGADGLVLFNRFYQPDFDLDELEVVSRLAYSTSAELRLPLLWISNLAGRLDTSFAATSGIHSGKDMAKALLAGADVCMSASALLNRGVGHCKVMLDDLTAWMTEKEYESVKQMQGAMSQKKVGHVEAFQRANYIKMLGSYEASF
jgi:dihydroorotate dehydrogenase (fumarate)